MKEDMALLIDNFTDMWNEHDIDGVMEVFTDDAVAAVYPGSPGGRNFFRGKDSIRQWVEMLFQDNIQLSLPKNLHVEGNRVSFDDELHLDTFAEMGLDQIPNHLDFTFENGRIRYFVGNLVGEAAIRVEEAIQAHQMV